MGKIKKHTEYYCDICGDKIQRDAYPFRNIDKFYKIKCYDHEGYRNKDFDYSYICSTCMRNIVKKIEVERKVSEVKND